MTDVNAKFLTAQRRVAAQFKCTECTQLFFPSEASWWKHVGDVHADVLAGFTTEEALNQYRNSKREESRIHRTFVSLLCIFCCLLVHRPESKGIRK